ncbi:MAG: hypothetical protein IT370_16825 [Deltaproteobacteria bacterium]|nr:hypothetical protein [Deltaproteobacteria bacterium]
MRAAALALGLALLALAGCGGASAAAPRSATPWQRYQAPAAGYAVDYPGTPTEVADSKDGSSTQLSMLGDSQGKRVLGVVSVSADKLHTDSSARLFDAMGAQLSQMFQCSAGAAQDLMLGGRRARDFELTHLETPAIRGRGRLLLDADKGRLYFIVLIAETAAGRADVARFFASLTLTE